MSDPKQAPRKSPEPPASQPVATPAPREKESGRVAFDARGNAVWEWKTAEGQFHADASTSLLRKLEAPDLRIEATAIAKAPEPAALRAKALPGGGFNPYDSAAVGGGVAATAPAKSKSPDRQAARPAEAPPPRPPGILQRLQSWVDGKGPAKR